MFDIDQHIIQISQKLQQLIKQCLSLQAENKKLKNELSRLKVLIGDKDEQLELYTLRLEVLKASKGEMTEEEKISFEKKINQYLKEIEKCIAFLNE